MGPVIRNVIRDVIRPVMGDQALPSQRFTPAARDYFARLDEAGLRVNTYDAANARLIDRLVANGGNFWPDSGAFCAMAGYLFPTGGTLIPLKDGHDAGTLNAFVTGDWNAVTGLKGDDSTKYVDSNRADNSDAQNDFAIWTYLTAAATGTTARMFFGVLDETQIWQSGTELRSRNRSSDPHIQSSTPSVTGLVGSSRAEAGEYLLRAEGASNTIAQTSAEPLSVNHYFFARNSPAGTASNKTDSRHAIYGIGPNLNGTGELAELDTILTDWQTDLANA